ncbi:MAG: TRAP transporter small permease [Labilithrix sp.]|nr:TRAP transporter small permease [Labilithrix sp.]
MADEKKPDSAGESADAAKSGDVPADDASKGAGAPKDAEAKDDASKGAGAPKDAEAKGAGAPKDAEAKDADAKDADAAARTADADDAARTADAKDADDAADAKDADDAADAKDADAADAKDADDAQDKSDKKPSSPWPSARKGETPAPPVAKPAPKPEDSGKAAWGAPLAKLDRAWTTLESRLAAGVLVAEVLTLVFWIGIRALSATGRAGPGMIFRALLTAIVLGAVAHRASRKHERHEVITTAAVVSGLVLGTQWGEAGTAYFSNLFAWLQNASILVFFGGVSELAKRFTLWLALLGASLATAQGKHINVDVVMRFLSPRARVPVAVLGWLAAAIVSISASWGFFDYVAVEEMRAPPTVVCPGEEASETPKRCPAPPMSKVDRVTSSASRNFFLATRQLSLDLKSFPKVITGTPYNQWLTPREWNEWLRAGGWERRFAAEDVAGFVLPEDGSVEFRNPSVTAIPGGTEAIPKLLVPLMNLVFSFGLLVIGLRFILRSLLAISGWVKVDPAAAHGDEELAHAHDHSPEADRAEAKMKETHS